MRTGVLMRWLEGENSMKKNIREGSVLGAAMLIYNLVLIRLFTRGEYWDFVIKNSE